VVAILITSVEMKSTDEDELVTPDKDEVPSEGLGVTVDVESSAVTSISEDEDAVGINSELVAVEGADVMIVDCSLGVEVASIRSGVASTFRGSTSSVGLTVAVATLGVSVLNREDAGVTEEVWVIISGVRSPEPSSSVDVRVELVPVTSVPGVTEGLSVASLSAVSWVIVEGFSVLYREEAAVMAVVMSAVPVSCDAVVTTGLSVL